MFIIVSLILYSDILLKRHFLLDCSKNKWWWKIQTYYLHSKKNDWFL